MRRTWGSQVLPPAVAAAAPPINYVLARPRALLYMKVGVQQAAPAGVGGAWAPYKHSRGSHRPGGIQLIVGHCSGWGLVLGCGVHSANWGWVLGCAPYSVLCGRVLGHTHWGWLLGCATCDTSLGWHPTAAKVSAAYSISGRWVVVHGADPIHELATCH